MCGTYRRGRDFVALSGAAAREKHSAAYPEHLSVPVRGASASTAWKFRRWTEEALRQTRQRIGMIFQHFNLMHTRTVAQNVAFSLKAAGWERSKIAPRVAEILTLVGLADKGEPFPGTARRRAKQQVGIAA